MYCDASKDELGCVLMQNGKVVAYGSTKANVVADALSCKNQGIIVSLALKEWNMVGTLNEFGVQMKAYDEKVYLGAQIAMPKLLNEVIESQKYDQEVACIKARIASGDPILDWTIHLDGSLRHQGSANKMKCWSCGSFEDSD
ncbi:hypothetical protein HYC85_028566 [Camellia sinensis]|uniref:Uncharacterized protein n=1 Tax=Camellia sinensis TaxID=4442 RepID=A0A7J7FVL9_CAMSI|nr:hypothetical protein HYC85_028566 [Camellia sinensis]